MRCIPIQFGADSRLAPANLKGDKICLVEDLDNHAVKMGAAVATAGPTRNLQACRVFNGAHIPVILRKEVPIARATPIANASAIFSAKETAEARRAGDTDLDASKSTDEL